MASQQQDLALYKDHSITQVRDKSLTLITHVQGTAPTWLVSGLIESYIFDTCNLINSSSQSHTKKYTNSNTRSKVLLFSFVNDRSPYDKFFKKMSLTTKTNFKFVELLNEIYDDEDSVLKKIQQEVLTMEDPNSPLTIIIESPDLLLHTTSMDVNKYLSFLQSLHRKCTNLVLISSIDKNLIEFHSSVKDNVEFKHTEFLTKILHKSNVILNLKPLETGRADDVTGTLTITKGLIDSLNVVEKEYLYLINKEGNVKLFYR